LAQLTEAGEGRYDLVALANLLAEGGVTTLKLTGILETGGRGLADDLLGGQWYRRMPDGRLVDGAWSTNHVDQGAEPPEIPPNLAPFDYADLKIHLSGPGGGTPISERNPVRAFHAMSRLVMDHVQVTYPDGTVIVLPPWSGIFSPGVDWVSLFEFVLNLPGLPAQGAPYTFAGVDATGYPIPGIEATDLWVGVAPPDPPTNVRAEVTAKGIQVRWDIVPPVPGSFDPGRNLGFYQIVLDNDAGQSVYGAVLYVPQHTIPGERGDMQPGRDFGKALNELPDGAYGFQVNAHAVAPEGSGGSGFECTARDPDERVLFTISNGVIRIP
jgi:hypothetical protein